MFTGLVEELGKVKNIARTAKSVRLTIAAKKVLTDVKLGDSIAVNGTCLTVVDYSHSFFTADVMPETVDRTALAALHIGDSVNLERTLSLGDRLGGHIVSGHIDCVGTISSIERNDIAVVVRIQTELSVMRYIIKKGSVAIDGISLTIVDCGRDWFIVSLIPHTAAMTTLGFKKNGDPVNLEADIIGKYVEKLLGLSSAQQHGESSVAESNVTLDLLYKYGFTS
jgi:riboflavin synthase